MDTIIAALDFSPASVNAAKYAADMAAATGANLVLLHVVQITKVSLALTSADMESYHVEKKPHALLAELKNELLLRTDNSITIEEVLLHGVAENELEKFINNQRPLVMVMGIDMQDGPNRHESHSFKAVDKIDCPVLIVPANTFFKGPESAAIIVDSPEMETNPLINRVTQLLQRLAGNVAELKVEMYSKHTIAYSMEEVLLQNRPGIVVSLCSEDGYIEYLYHSIQRYQASMNRLPPLLSIRPDKELAELAVNGLTGIKKHDCKVCNGACRKIKAV